MRGVRAPDTTTPALTGHFRGALACESLSCRARHAVGDLAAPRTHAARRRRADTGPFALTTPPRQLKCRPLDFICAGRTMALASSGAQSVSRRLIDMVPDWRGWIRA